MPQTQKKLISFNILLALTIIFLVDAIGFGLDKYTHREQEGLAKIINISGRQRMLSQRITLLITEITFATNSELLFEDLNAKIKLFKESHELLKNEAITRDEKNKDLQPLYFLNEGLNSQVANFLNTIEELREGDLSEVKKSSLNKLASFAKGPLLANLNEAVSLFESKSDDLADLENAIGIFLFNINIVALVLIYLFILKPLQDAVVSREEELEVAREKAEDDSRFKSMFLANMSHELRTPLNGVLGTADLIGSTKLDEEQIELLKIINQSGKILLGVVNNILDLTKLQMGNVEIEQITFDPEEFIYNVPKSFRYPLESKGLGFTVECINLPSALLGDTTRLGQIFNNILANAVKFTEKGGIHLKANYLNGKLEIQIKDTGVGMDQKALNKIFESFIQADASTTRKFGGTGLGLSITKELIELMGGVIKVTSELNKGSVFDISIPLALGNPNDLPKNINTHLDQKTLAGENKRVLVVDDNDINRKLMSKILTRHELISIEADGPYAFLDLLDEQEFDLILMDYHMPGMNGIEVFLKAKEKHLNLPPVVALTADVMEETRIKVLEAGMKELIPKPIQRDDLHRVLSTYLQIEINK